jgi:hypothetical protein
LDAKTAARIQALTMSPGWDDLTEALTKLEDKFWQRHIADVKSGRPIDQRVLDRTLGKFDGIRVLLNAPDKAAAILLREVTEDDGA